MWNIALYSIGLYFHHQSHPPMGVVFSLAPSLHSFWSYFSSDLQFCIGHLLTWGVHLSVSYLFAFSSCFVVIETRVLKWFALPFSSALCFVRALHRDLSILDGYNCHGSEFHWVWQGCGPCDQIGWFSVIVVFSLSALWRRRIEAYWSFLMGETDWGGNWVLFWWAGPCSVNL